MSTRPSASSKIAAAALVGGLSALLAGCSSTSTSSMTVCRSTANCPIDGEECNLATHLCEQVCTQAECQAGSECSSYFGRCVPVSCGQIVQCKDAGDFCDLTVHECYPSSGKCSSKADCPLFDGRVSKSATVVCRAGFCRIDSAVPPLVAAAAAVRVLSPSPGTQVATADALQFQWEEGLGVTTIALVVTDLPKDLSQVLTSAVWGRVLPADARPVALWQDGVAIQGGVWLQSSAAVPSGPLYFIVQAVRSGQLVGMSAPISFRVGSQWPALRDPCSDNEVLPGSCANPTRPQICWEGSCRHLCTSHVDCNAEGTLCEIPKNGVRICG